MSVSKLLLEFIKTLSKFCGQITVRYLAFHTLFFVKKPVLNFEQFGIIFRPTTFFLVNGNYYHSRQLENETNSYQLKQLPYVHKKRSVIQGDLFYPQKSFLLVSTTQYYVFGIQDSPMIYGWFGRTSGLNQGPLACRVGWNKAGMAFDRAGLV